MLQRCTTFSITYVFMSSIDLNTSLLSKVGSGNRKAFKRLYDILLPKVYSIVLSYMQNTHEAEEVTQDVFTKVFLNAKKFKGKSSVDTWVYRIAINTSLTALQKRNKRSLFSLSDKPIHKTDFVHPGVILERQEFAIYFFKAIDTLKEKQKTAIILKYVEGTSQKKIAEIMNTSVKAVESLLQRAKKSLGKKLDKMYPSLNIKN